MIVVTYKRDKIVITINYFIDTLYHGSTFNEMKIDFLGHNGFGNLKALKGVWALNWKHHKDPLCCSLSDWNIASLRDAGSEWHLV